MAAPTSGTVEICPPLSPSDMVKSSGLSISKSLPDPRGVAFPPRSRCMGSASLIVAAGSLVDMLSTGQSDSIL